MSKWSKLQASLLANPNQLVAFRDFEGLLVAAGFECKRERGSHKSYRHLKVPDILTVQPHGKDARRYQVRRFLDIMRSHAIEVDD